MISTRQKFFAVAGPRQGRKQWGYVLDYYPEEKARYSREYGKLIIGDFASKVEADAAVYAALCGKQIS